jgi:O-antigen/teichoic acid export membrane protein
MGGYFFILQTSVAVATSADNFIVARMLGPAAVTEFSITARMFSIVPLMLIMALNPLWPAYGESIARGELGWALTTLRRSLVVIFSATSISSILLVVSGHSLLRVWVGSEINPSIGLLAAIGAAAVLTTAANGVGVFLNGANLMRVEVISGICLALGATFFKVIFVHRVGLTGIPLGTILAYSLFVWIPIVLFVPRLLSQLRLSCCGGCAPELAVLE